MVLVLESVRFRTQLRNKQPTIPWLVWLITGVS